jgi:hypothetical protein
MTQAHTCPECKTTGIMPGSWHQCTPDPLVTEIKDAIFEVELLIEVHRTPDGPRTAKQRTEFAEMNQRVGQLTKVRRALYRALEAINPS